MTEPVLPPSEPFVPVAEVLRERGERSWLGEPWSKPELLVLLLVTLAGGALRLWHLVGVLHAGGTRAGVRAAAVADDRARSTERCSYRCTSSNRCRVFRRVAPNQLVEGCTIGNSCN